MSPRVARVNKLQNELVVVTREWDILGRWLKENPNHPDREERYDEYMTLEFTADVLDNLVTINMSVDGVEPR